jgi:hypothetical protein
MNPQLLALWSVPRARSTAFLRMMTERGDYLVIHEPFSRVTDFGETDVAGRRCTSVTHVMAALMHTARSEAVFYKDTMDYRYPDVLASPDFLQQVTHSFMIRPPTAVISSHLRVDPSASRDAMGFELLWEMMQAVRVSTDQELVVLDGDDLVADVEQEVRSYCHRVGMSFLGQALTWKPGALPQWDRTQGWHESVSRTDGFRATSDTSALEPALQSVADGYLRHHQPFYDLIRSSCVGRS